MSMYLFPLDVCIGNAPVWSEYVRSELFHIVVERLCVGWLLVSCGGSRFGRKGSGSLTGFWGLRFANRTFSFHMSHPDFIIWSAIFLDELFGQPWPRRKCPLLIAVTYVKMAGLKARTWRYFASCCLVVLLLMILMLFFFSSLAGRFPDFVALLPGCILISSTFDQAFCSSLFDFLPRLSWGFTPGFLVVVGCLSARSSADFFRKCMRPWRCPSGLVVIVEVPCGHGGRR